MIVKRFLSQKNFACNAYVCSINQTNFIIDLGHFDQSLKNYIDQIGGIDFILLTHAHFDHMMGVDELLKVYPSVKVYGIYETNELAHDDKLNGSKLFLGNSIIPNFKVECLKIGINKIENISFELIYNPGHTCDSVSYYFKEHNALFVGDFLFLASIGRCDLPTGNNLIMQDSIHSFLKRKFENNLKIYSGHDKEFSYQNLLRINPYLA